MSELNSITTKQGKIATNGFLYHSNDPSNHIFPLLGTNGNILKIKNQLKYLSQKTLPVFISGETGTEKHIIAKYIHHSRNTESGNFIYVPSYIKNIEEFKWHLESSIQNAINGTLFISEIDKLSETQKDYLSICFSNQDIYKMLAELNIQLIISCTEPVICGQQFLSRILGSAIPHLELSIPPLKKRSEDISIYIDHFLNKFGTASPSILTSEAKELLCNYSWPGNVSQLQKVIIALISSSPKRIQKEDVLALGMIKDDSIRQDLFDCLINKKLNTYKKLHPALYKALDYISLHYSEDISLQNVSAASFTSSSHLSFLFRESLHISFKAILVQLRVNHAKDLIEKRPMVKITDVSLQAGFGDLSHFEKMFKRYVGCTPRQFRTQQRQEYVAQIA